MKENGMINNALGGRKDIGKQFIFEGELYEIGEVWLRCLGCGFVDDEPRKCRKVETIWDCSRPDNTIAMELGDLE